MARTTSRTAARANVVAFDAQARAAARAAGLCYVTDAAPGIRRVRKRGRGRFEYRDAGGRRSLRAAELARIERLAIPPAWTDVWICPSARGHVQATGRDARGRKQYRYHAAWTYAREQAKHARICEFAARLERVRSHCRQLLARRGLTRDKVLAALLCIVDLTSIRVGHEEYVRDNDHFGLTTLRSRHVRVRGCRVQLRFRGKSGMLRQLSFTDRALARVVAQCRALAGPQLFKFRDDSGKIRRVTADHVNAFLREQVGPVYSVKDFRTWAATVCVAVELSRAEPPSSPRAARKHVVAAIRVAAEQLGNTPAVCRKSYVHPLVITAFEHGRVLPSRSDVRVGCASYREHEACVRRFLLSLVRGDASESRRAS